jgi:hypothetical protein
MKLPANQSAVVQVGFTNANGLPAKVQGDVSWESSDPAIARVEAKPGNTEQATVTAGPSAGIATIYATADADMGEGVREAEATVDITVVARGEAVGGEITLVRPDQGLPPGRGQPGQPDNSLPGQGRPDNSLPGQPGHPDQGLPPAQGRPDQGLPGQPGHPDQGLPPAQGRPDQGLPGGRPERPDQGLPPSSGKPDQGLPGTPQPKKR